MRESTMAAIFFSMFTVSTQILKTLHQQVFPRACPICHTVLFATEHKSGCCPNCLLGIQVMGKHTCERCGIIMPASLAPGPYGACLQRVLPQQHTESLFIYKDAVREALLAWKLQGQSNGLDWLLETAQPQLQQIFSEHDLLIPVPMPLSRMQKSGIHHSADLCQKIARVTGATMDWKLLRRTGTHTRQSALKGKARQNNLCKAFTLVNDYKQVLKTHQIQRKIWVIDDILTTGATLRHACQAMRRAKQPVFAFSFARTPRD
ncbi:MAG: ComF family protein [Ghiorsea sp.]